MRTRGQPIRGIRQIAVVVVLSLLVIGCEPSQPTPSATSDASASLPAESTRSPSPSLADALRTKLRDPNFAARVAIHGTETVPSTISFTDAGSPIPSPSVDPLVLQWEGEAYVSGENYLLRLQVVDQPQLVIEELRLGTGVRRRTFSHSWEPMPTAQDDVAPKLFAQLAGLDRLEPIPGAAAATGTVRLKPPATTELSLVTIFMQEEAKKEPDRGTVEIEAKADGTPVRVTVAIDSDDLDYSDLMPADSLKVPPRNYDFEFEYDVVDRVPLPELEPPTEPMDSRFGPSLEYPLGWTTDQTQEDFDEAGDDNTVLRVFQFPVPEQAGDEEQEQLDAAAGWVINDLGMGSPETIESTEVAGHPAYLLAFGSAPDDDDPFFHLEAVFVEGGRMYTIAWHAYRRGTELKERYEFERVLETVQLDPA